MSAPAPETKAKPEPYLTVPISGENKTFFMSFGLLNELSALVGGPEGVPQLSFHPQMGPVALNLVLALRNKRGEILDPDDWAVPADLDPEAAELMIDWISAHVLDFFVRRLAKSAALLGTKATDLAAVGSSLNSSANSPGKTQSS